jgi:hypothetical protein
MPPTSDELEAWIPLKAGLSAVKALNRPDLMRERPNEDARKGAAFADDPFGSWLGDEVEVPLWLFTISRAFSTAFYVPFDLTLAEAVALVEHDAERRDGLAVMARMGVFRSSDVIARLLEWRESA